MKKKNLFDDILILRDTLVRFAIWFFSSSNMYDTLRLWKNWALSLQSQMGSFWLYWHLTERVQFSAPIPHINTRYNNVLIWNNAIWDMFTMLNLKATQPVILENDIISKFDRKQQRWLKDCNILCATVWWFFIFFGQEDDSIVCANKY